MIINFGKDGGLDVPNVPMRPLGDTPPSQGGCWYCHSVTNYEDDPLVLCREFDTYIHRDCVKKRMQLMRRLIQSDPENETIAREFGIWEEGNA